MLPPEKLSDLINSYARDAESLKEQIFDICYFIKGVDYNSAWGMSFSDRDLAIKIINKRLKEQNPGAKEYM